jgi:hypothetical protein
MVKIPFASSDLRDAVDAAQRRGHVAHTVVAATKLLQLRLLPWRTGHGKRVSGCVNAPLPSGAVLGVGLHPYLVGILAGGHHILCGVKH